MSGQLLHAGHRKEAMKLPQPEGILNLIGKLHLTKVRANGDVEFTQGLSEMPGVIFKSSVPYYLERFDFHSQNLIDEQE